MSPESDIGAFAQSRRSRDPVSQPPAMLAGYPDGAKRPDNDVWLLWPERVRISVIPEDEWKAFEGGSCFAAIPCFNLALDFDETLMMDEKDWNVFTQACRDAADVTATCQVSH